MLNRMKIRGINGTMDTLVMVPALIKQISLSILWLLQHVRTSTGNNRTIMEKVSLPQARTAASVSTAPFNAA
jgi:hypothetical protein